MTHIPIKSFEDKDSPVIYFPIPSDGNLTMGDLKSAFPSLIALRYTDQTNDMHHHILCRNDIFVEPYGGWKKEGRTFWAVNASMGYSNSSAGLFETYRTQISSRQRPQDTTSKTSNDKKVESATTMITVGHGHFKGHNFSKISTTSLSGCGGLVIVGPFNKLGDTSEQIKMAAFQKFTQMNRSFRRKYSNGDQFYLLYADGTKVTSLPDNSDEFSIQGYRDYIDKNKRFDRLRFYLCEKQNFDLYNSIEIITDSSSSDDGLPELTTRNQETISTSSADNTLPLVVRVTFHFKDSVIIESFPNNTRGSVLLDYISKQFALSASSVLITQFASRMEVKPEDRLMDLSSSSEFSVAVVEKSEEFNLEQAESDIDTEEIPANHAMMTSVPDILVNKVLTLGSGTSEPTAFLHQYVNAFLRGRPLDIQQEDEVIDGDVSPIFISRATLLEDTIEEMKFVENIRNPLEVNFHGESARDYGGPRKEFFSLAVQHIKERLLTVEDGNVVLVQDDELLARQAYYYCGLIIGLSAIQGGPFADYLESVITNSPTGDGKKQFLEGLQRTGILQMIQKKSTVKYLFRKNSQNILNVHKFLHLFPVLFNEEGSSRRTREESAYREFIRYLREVFAGRRGNVTLEKILKFSTGALELPILGFTMEPSIVFIESMFPTASTCINRLLLPLEINFEKLDLAFLNDFFGLE